MTSQPVNNCFVFTLVGIDATDMDTPLQRGVSGSQFAQTHSFQRVITPATCKICNSLFLRGGVYCSKVK